MEAGRSVRKESQERNFDNNSRLLQSNNGTDRFHRRLPCPRSSPEQSNKGVPCVGSKFNTLTAV